MPIYEYRCSSCGLTFARLQPVGAGGEGIICPSCDSDQVTRAVSTFGCCTASPSQGAPASPAGRSCASSG